MQIKNPCRRRYRYATFISAAVLGRSCSYPATSPPTDFFTYIYGNFLMSQSPFILQEQQFLKIRSVLERVRVECAARVVFHVDRDGQTIAFNGEIGDMDTTSFSSLAAGNVAATSSMAKLIGEDVFPSVVHEGERESIFISVIGRSLLVVVFDEHSTIGLVKLRAKRASHEIAAILDEATRQSPMMAGAASAFSEITDDDIDSLFR
jgi:predicted regulator of Ras-like GTPase activity (Roadblock/LC7/MglB family)